MGYRSDVRISTTKEGYEILKTKCASLNLDYNLMEEGHYLIDKTEDDNIAFGWEWIKWYDSYPEIQAINNCLNELEEKGIPYIFARIGESVDDCEEIYSGDVNDLLYLTIERNFNYD